MGRRTDCSSGAEERWRVGKEQETWEREPHRNICSRAAKAIDSQQMDTTKPYKTPPAQPTDSEKQEGKEAWLYGHRMSRHQVPSLPIIV